MKFTELSIQTQRSAPSDIRSEGLVFLYRAGYFSRTGEPLSLGQIAIERLQQSEMQQGSAFISSLHIPTAHAQEDGRVFALHPTGPEELLLCSSCGYAAVMARAGHAVCARSLRRAGSDGGHGSRGVCRQPSVPRGLV